MNQPIKTENVSQKIIYPFLYFFNTRHDTYVWCLACCMVASASAFCKIRLYAQFIPRCLCSSLFFPCCWTFSTAAIYIISIWTKARSILFIKLFSYIKHYKENASSQIPFMLIIKYFDFFLSACFFNTKKNHLSHCPSLPPFLPFWFAFSLFFFNCTNSSNLAITNFVFLILRVHILQSEYYSPFVLKIALQGKKDPSFEP